MAHSHLPNMEDHPQREWIPMLEEKTEDSKILRSLAERVKELNTLYRASKIITQSDGNLETTLQRIASVIPTGWQYPEVCCCRISVKGVVATSPRFKEGKWRQAEDIKVNGKRLGLLEVFYLADRPEADEGPFLLEERNLIIELSDRISEFLKIRESKNELDNFKEKYRNLFGEGEELIIYLNSVGKGSNRIAFCNQNVESITGYGHEELYLMSILDLIADDSKKGMEESLGMLSGAVSCDGDTMLVGKDEKIHGASFNAYRIRISGRGNVLLVIALHR